MKYLETHVVYTCIGIIPCISSSLMCFLNVANIASVHSEYKSAPVKLVGHARATSSKSTSLCKLNLLHHIRSKTIYIYIL